MTSRRLRRFRCILADPPWKMEGGGGRAASEHYPTVDSAKLPSIMRAASDARGSLWLPAEDALMGLWVTNNYLEDGLWVLSQLGFPYVTNVAWIKTADPATVVRAAFESLWEKGITEAARDLIRALRLEFGIGHYFRGSHELLLIGVRGKALTNACTAARNIPSVIRAPVPKENGKRVHSRKPEAAYEMMEARTLEPRLEMFARRRRPGWTAWGNEIGDCDG
jgi:N6-adenosine-specific RNA methylase IME4